MNLKPLGALALLFSVSLFAQSSGGVAGISGVVRDPAGASVPNAKVVISSQGQGVARSLTTNEAGVFSAPALTPGPGYKVTVTAAGFNTYEADNLVLAVGQTLALDIALTVGASVTQVDVSAAATMVDDVKSDVSTVVGTHAAPGLAHQRTARGLFRAADSRRHQRRHLRPAELPRRGGQ